MSSSSTKNRERIVHISKIKDERQKNFLKSLFIIIASNLFDQEFPNYDHNRQQLSDAFAQVKEEEKTMNIYNDEGESLLSSAILNSHPLVALDLVKKGADVNTLSADKEPVLVLANSHNMYNLTLELLKDKNINTNVRGIDGKFPIHEPIFVSQNLAEEPNPIFNNYKVMKELIKKGANVNALDNDKMTPLMTCMDDFSVHEEYILKAMKILINNHADITKSDKDGNLALHHAIIKGFSTIALYLIEKGSDKDHYNKSAMTPMHLAVEYNLPDVVVKLHDKGADMYARNNENKLPEELVTKESHINIKNLFNWHTKKPIILMNESLNKKRKKSTSSNSKSKKRVLGNRDLSRYISSFSGVKGGRKTRKKC